MTHKTHNLSGWRLTELLPDTEESTISTRLVALEEAVAAFVARRAELSPELAPATLLELLRDYEAITEQIYKLYAYGSLWFSADTQDPSALTYRNRMQQVLTATQNRLLFFDLWWKELSDEQAERLLPSTEHGDFRHYLADLRRTKPFTLDEKSEQLINIKDANGVDGLMTLYTMLTSRLEFTIEVDGEQ